MSCDQFTIPECRTVQVLEPDDTLLVGTSSGSVDQSLDERGDYAIPLNTLDFQILFTTLKASAVYKFEYLYIDYIGDILNQANTIVPTVVIQNQIGFAIKLSAVVPDVNYVLRWRVVVQEIDVSTHIDEPETIYFQLPRANTATVLLVNPRSSADWGFNEFRVENLTDPVASQTPILAQVVARTQFAFQIGLSPTPNTNNYYLAARTR
jgi:hypothetical protein